MKDFSIIVAADSKNGIGKNGDLAWRLCRDLNYFKEVTTDSVEGKINAVIMGRTTWESIPEKFRPLPRRLNCVLTRQNISFDGAETFGSLEDCIKSLENNPEVDKIFVIGGAQLYDYSIELNACRKVFLTEVDGDFGCDVFFPKIPEIFTKTSESEKFEENGIGFKFSIFQK